MTSRASLNRAYRTVWNASLGVMVAVAETSRTPLGGSSNCVTLSSMNAAGGSICALALGVALAWGHPGYAFANPTGGIAVTGQANFNTQGNKLLVTTQNGAGQNHSAINWQSFSIPAGSTTYFQQPSATSTSINRVVTNTPSQIFGSLGSNGKLVLVNQSGITVGKDALVDTAGFTASSLGMRDADAAAGRMRFGDGSGGDGGVSVLGNILVRTGDVVLLGSNVATGKDALIQAPNGTTLLAAGQQIELTGRGLEGITLQVQAPHNEVVNLGTLKGDAVGVFAGTLRHSGMIQAQTASLEGGKVILKASGDAYLEGSGLINAASTAGNGGSVDILGRRVALMDKATVDVSGVAGGGSVRVGGDYQGKNPDVLNAAMTYTGGETIIRADATESGNGGRVILWADDTTRASGQISVRGGANGGNGGFVETSGRRYLEATRAPDLTAPVGKGGVWLLDPSDINITSTAGALITGGSPFSPTQGYGDATPSLLNVTTLETALAAGNVVVDASTGAGSGNGSITVTAPINWSSSSNLQLTATQNIAINAAVAGVAGSLTLQLGGAATQTAPISVSNLTVNTVGTVTLTNTGNQVGTFAANASSTMPISYWNSGALTLGAITTASFGSDLDLKSISGSVTTSGAINGNAVSISAGAGIFHASGGSVSTGVNGSISLTGASIGATGTGNYVQVNPGVRPVTLTASSGGIYVEQQATSPTLSLSNYTVSAAGASQKVYLAGQSINAVFSGYQTNTNDDFIGLFATGSPSSIVFPGTTITKAASGFVLDANSISFAGSGNATNLNAPVVASSNGNLTLSGNLATTASGTAFTAASANYAGLLNASAFSLTSSGRWLTYLGDVTAAHNFGPLVLANSSDFVQYNAYYNDSIFGTTSPLGSSAANGRLFQNYAVLNPLMAGSVTKVFDGTANASLSGVTFSCTSCNPLNGDNLSNVSFSGGSGFYGTRPDGPLYDANVGTNKPVFVDPGLGSPVSVNGILTASGSFPVFGYKVDSSANIGTITPARVVASVSLSGSRPYDGTNVVNASIFSISGLLFGETLTLSGEGTVADKNVGDNKSVSLGTLALGNGSGLASNYTLTSATASITPLKITGITGLTVDPRLYDGGIKAILSDKSVPVFAGMVPNDKLTLTADAGTFIGVDGRHVGIDKPVEFTGIKLGGADAVNYLLDPGLTTLAAKGTIQQLDNVSWIGGDGAWSVASNWAGGAIPDRQNVKNVDLPSGVSVTYNDGDTVLQSLSGGRLVITGGSLEAPGLAASSGLELNAGTLKTSSSITVPTFVQTGGTLTTTGSFTVNGSFSQANGSIVAVGPASITQNTGSLNIANLEAAGISVQALNGAVTQSGAWKSGAVSVDSAAGAILTNAGNRISSFRATSSGAGNVELVNTGVLNVLGITTPSGNIVISNIGGVTTTGVVSTGSGSITGTANSPLTIGPDGLFATGDIVLTATNRTSAGNLTLLGNVSTSGGAVNLDAGQDFVQNGSVFGALGVAAAIGGSASFGPDASTKGFPVRYVAGGVPVIPPGAGVQPGVTSGAGGNAPTDFVLTFLTKFDQALEQQVASSDTPGEKKKDDNGVVVEGQTCTR